MTCAHPSPRPVDEHVALLRDLLAPPASRGRQTVPLTEAVGRSVTDHVVAPIDLPGVDNAQMDGFAVAAAATPGTLPVAATIAAGDAPSVLPAGHAAPVMTGAPVPTGADAVVPVEDTAEGRFDVTEVGLPAVPAGRFVRPAGSDVARGERVLEAGTVLGPAAVGLLAALGRVDVEVRPRPRVLVCTGGDEVVAPGRALRAGQVHDANGPLLAAQLTALGADVVGHLRLSDDPAAFRTRLAAEVAACVPDLVVTSGGVSAGRFEVVRAALDHGGVRFGPVAMQPGGPQGAGRLDDGTPVVCLPGNPVSTWVSVLVLLQPALAATWGTAAPRRRRAVLGGPAEPLPTRTQYRRAVRRADAPDVVDLTPGTSSHLLAQAARADSLVSIPPGTATLPAGTAVDVLDL